MTNMTTNAALKRARNKPRVAKCVGCGCTDGHACQGGCGWTIVNYEQGNGVCTQCDGAIERFMAGDRTFRSDRA